VGLRVARLLVGDRRQGLTGAMTRNQRGKAGLREAREGRRRAPLTCSRANRCCPSGISIENPDRARVPGGNVVKNLLRRAAEAGPPASAIPSTSRAFSGGGHTLGSDEVESSFIPDPDAPSSASEQTAIRHLTFWKEGFSVDDGELMRYDDPANEQILEEINSGRAPPSILNVLPGQPVELRVARRLSENYTPPARGAFSGSGNRLGAPSPSTTFEAAHGSTAMPGSFPSGARCPVVHGGSAPASSSSTTARSEPNVASFGTRFEVDQSQPTTSVQVRLADGTRMVCRMNLTHTVQDLRNFINAYVLF
jgi:UBX domain-containing protein 1